MSTKKPNNVNVVIDANAAQHIIDELNADANADVTANVQSASKTITPKTLSEMFNIDQKTIRRHLRKHFHENHQFNNSWTWTHDDAALKPIIEFFEKRYAIAK